MRIIIIMKLPKGNRECGSVSWNPQTSNRKSRIKINKNKKRRSLSIYLSIYLFERLTRGRDDFKLN